MTYSCFDVSMVGKVAHVQLKRPDELNTMVPAFWRELPEIIAGISDEGAARAIVVSSTGRHFTAGMDLAVFGDGESGALRHSAEAGRRQAMLRVSALDLQDSFTAFERARMPVLAAIQGGCIGGGVDMVSAADMRYCSADAFFSIQEINIGMTADVGTLQRLPKLISDGLVRELAYTGRRMHADEALACGLVNRVFEDHESLVAGVLEIGQTIATKSPLAIWGTKETVNYTRDHSVADSLNYIATWQAGMFQPADMVESFTAKSEHRDPEFEDLPAVPKYSL